MAEHPDQFARVVLSNGALPTGDQEVTEAFNRWLAFSQRVPVLPIRTILQMGTETQLGREALEAYNAPFPGEAYKAGARSAHAESGLGLAGG